MDLPSPDPKPAMDVQIITLNGGNAICHCLDCRSRILRLAVLPWYEPFARLRQSTFPAPPMELTAAHFAQRVDRLAARSPLN